MPTIRTATDADEATVLDLLEQLFEPPGHRPVDYSRDRARDHFRRYLAHPDADVLLAEDAGAVLGLASVYVDLPSMRYGLRCWLEDLVVHRDLRGRGIGRLLLDAATAWAREHGCTHLELDSGMGRTDAHRFYQAQGMTQSLSFARQIER